MTNSVLAYAEALKTTEDKITWMHEMKAFGDEYLSADDDPNLDPEIDRKMTIICQAFSTVLKDY